MMHGQNHIRFLVKYVVRSNIFRTDREVTLTLRAQNSVGRCRRWEFSRNEFAARVTIEWCLGKYKSVVFHLWYSLILNMADLKEILCCMFCFKVGKYVTEFFEMLKIVFGKQATKRTQVIYRVKGRACTHTHKHAHKHTHIQGIMYEYFPLLEY